MNATHFAGISATLITPPRLTTVETGDVPAGPVPLKPEACVHAWVSLKDTAARTVTLPSGTAVGEWLGPDRRDGTSFWLMASNDSDTNVAITLARDPGNTFQIGGNVTLAQGEKVQYLCNYDDNTGIVTCRKWFQSAMVVGSDHAMVNPEQSIPPAGTPARPQKRLPNPSSGCSG